MNIQLNYACLLQISHIWSKLRFRLNMFKCCSMLVYCETCTDAVQTVLCYNVARMNVLLEIFRRKKHFSNEARHVQAFSERNHSSQIASRFMPALLLQNMIEAKTKPRQQALASHCYEMECLFNIYRYQQ